jgi:hypothetical protein
LASFTPNRTHNLPLGTIFSIAPKKHFLDFRAKILLLVNLTAAHRRNVSGILDPGHSKESAYFPNRPLLSTAIKFAAVTPI